MVFVIDFSSDEAFYIQLRNQIIMGIAASDIQDGDSLPSVRDLAESIGINMHTVNKAYSILRQEGYLRLDRRRGAVVAVNINKLRALEQLRMQMKVILAQAICSDVSSSEIHGILDDILREFSD